jgi:hypothetical protein
MALKRFPLKNFIFNNFIRLLFVIVSFATSSCDFNDSRIDRAFFDVNGSKLGDSIMQGGILNKLVFTDLSCDIDSIVYTYYDNGKLASYKTYKKGKPVFQNLEYYENGNIKKFSFIDEDRESYYYERQYFESGLLKSISGKPFYQCYLHDTIDNNPNFVKGSEITYRIFAPTPPDCESKVYIYDSLTSEKLQLRRNKSIGYLFEVIQDADDTGYFKVDINLELKDKSMDTVYTYKNNIIFNIKE